MFRALGDRLRSVPNWWLEPVLAALLFAVVAGTSLGYVIPPSSWASSILICLGASLSALLPWVGASLTLVGLLTQLAVDQA